jgi:hypothetical protein
MREEERPKEEPSALSQHTSAYVQHTSAYVSIRQHTSAYVSIPKEELTVLCSARVISRTTVVPGGPHSSSFAEATEVPTALPSTVLSMSPSCTYVSIRQHTVAYVSRVSIRQHTYAVLCLCVCVPHRQTQTQTHAHAHTSTHTHIHVEREREREREKERKRERERKESERARERALLSSFLLIALFVNVTRSHLELRARYICIHVCINVLICA